jgi:hypothetical protein
VGVAGRDPATVQINGASGDGQPEPGAAIDRPVQRTRLAAGR